MRQRFLRSAIVAMAAIATFGCAPIDDDQDGHEPPFDCNDGDPSIHPDAEEIPYDGVDQDCDRTEITDADGDGFVAREAGGTDCLDQDAGAFPGADEIPYDGIDNDCSGSELDDVDRDGFSGGAEGRDCDDIRADVSPAGVDACGDGVDQDCSGGDLECTTFDADGDGYSPVEGDCNDENPRIHPGSADMPYDGIDEDCSTETPDDDLDRDGFGRRGGGDCNDADASVFPGADEVPYDAVDQDCSGTDLSDVDRDGFSGGELAEDCDDTRPDVHTAGVEVCGDAVDQDCSGADLACSSVDRDGDGYSPTAGDCNDGDTTIHPGAAETPYDGADDDCDATTRDDDLDADGFRSSAGGGGDCDDAKAMIRPGAPEVPYDGVDQDCSGFDLTDRDGDGFGGGAAGDDCDDLRADVSPIGADACGDAVDQDCSGADLSCSSVDADGDGYSPSAGDCNDGDAGIGPAVAETPYNGFDDDCDAATREDDLDVDGFTRIGGGDCNDVDPAVRPSADETPYDGIDQDCSGTDLTDVDGDGFDAGILDCEDLDAAIHPERAEIPYDSIDQNCDGSDYVGNATILAEGSAHQADVAFNGTDYLAVYRQYDPATGRWSTRGELIAADGTPSGTVLPIYAADSIERVRVASNGSEFLVVWLSFVSGSSGWSVMGQRLGADGSLLGSPITIRSATNSGYYVDVAFGGGTYLVAFRNYDGSVHAINAVTVDPGTGAVSSATTFGGASDAPNEPAVASDGTGFLVAYGRYDRGGTDRQNIFAQRLAADGSLTGGEIRLSSRSDDQYTAEVASDGASYLVVWRGYDSGDWDVFGQFVSATDGSLLYTPAEENLEISTAPNVQQWPSAAFIDGAFTVVWWDNRHVQPALYGQRIAPDGSPIGSSVFMNEAVLAEAQQYYEPRLASGGTNGYVVYHSSDDVFGSLIDN